MQSLEENCKHNTGLCCVLGTHGESQFGVQGGTRLNRQPIDANYLDIIGPFSFSSTALSYSSGYGSTLPAPDSEASKATNLLGERGVLIACIIELALVGIISLSGN